MGGMLHSSCTPETHFDDDALNSFDRIVASIVRAQGKQFLINIAKWLLVAIPGTFLPEFLDIRQFADQYRFSYLYQFHAHFHSD